MQFIKKAWPLIFGKPWLYKFNLALFQLGLRGIGVLNSATDRHSGEKWLMRFLSQRYGIKTVFDVGANEGAYALGLLAAKPEIRVYCFEPHPVTYAKLLLNVSATSAKCFNIALSDQIGNLSFYDYKDADGSEHASMYEDVISKIHKKESHEIKVKALTLDSFLVENDISEIDLLKIDTEGNEYSVLKGSVDSLQQKRIKIIHFEFNEMNVISRSFFRDFENLLVNFELFRLLPQGLLPLNGKSPVFVEIFAYQNIVAIRKDLVSN